MGVWEQEQEQKLLASRFSYSYISIPNAPCRTFENYSMSGFNYKVYRERSCPNVRGQVFEEERERERI